MSSVLIEEKEVDRIYTIIKNDAERGGYFLNPDVDFYKKSRAGSVEK